MAHRKAAWLALALLVWCVHAGAQTFSSRTLGVRVDVLVTDGHNPVAGLTAGDFELRDNGVVQRIEVVDAHDIPINAILALDTSSSTTGQRQKDLITAGQAFLDGLTPVDRAALTTFSNFVIPAVPLTSDLAQVRSGVAKIVPEGRTAILDGLYVALAATFDEPGRFLVVVCTDGSDTASWLDPVEVQQALQRSNAVVYAVTSADARRSPALKDATDASGGHMLQVRGSAELRATFERILREFRTRYVLAYEPQGVAPGGFHQIDVTVPHRRLTINARRGYVGQAPVKQP